MFDLHDRQRYLRSNHSLAGLIILNDFLIQQLIKRYLVPAGVSSPSEDDMLPFISSKNKGVLQVLKTFSFEDV